MMLHFYFTCVLKKKWSCFFCFQEMLPEALLFLFLTATERRSNSVSQYQSVYFVYLQFLSHFFRELEYILLNFYFLCTCKIIWYLSHNSCNFLLIFAVGCLYCVWLGSVADSGLNLCPRLYSCNEHNLEKSNLRTSHLLCISFLHIRKYTVHVLPQKEKNKRIKPSQFFKAKNQLASANELLL